MQEKGQLRKSRSWQNKLDEGGNVIPDVISRIIIIIIIIVITIIIINVLLGMLFLIISWCSPAQGNCPARSERCKYIFLYK